MKDAIEKLIQDHLPVKTWEAGKDWVQYSGTYYDNEEYYAAISSIMKGWFGIGPETVKFERGFAKLFNKQHALFTNSGSSANLLMVSALASKNGYNFKKGTKIVTPIAGFPTTINPIFQVGFEPVFVDIEMETLNIDTTQAWDKADREPDIKALMFAYALGNCPDMGAVMEIVKNYDLLFLEDCCDALGTTYNNHLLGSYGVMATCSTYPAHHISCLSGGGVVASNDPNIHEVLRSMRSWGNNCVCVGKANFLADGTCGCRFSKWIPEIDEVFDHKYVYTEIGYNLKPIELQAAVGLAQIKKLPDIIEKRKRNHKLLWDLFAPYDEFILHPARKNSDPSWFAFPVTLKDGVKFKRHEICRFFEAHKIQTRQYFGGNMMLQPAYRGYMSAEEIKKFPVANKVMKDTFFLGVSPVITPEMIDYIGTILKKFMNQ